ncbi:hypothetical protein [Halomarina oriensis]|uniref:Uncharacterized protein n=1 Tax=Halomarina oriensis TaxID=671145 RepID=A0A6B0GST9_9EURY|nr:hypothetical protein [Halomarina oriensis]MWG34728.1 hypothetical protein [Halomarina oriensis]
MATANHPESPAESFRTLATDLIESGVVSILALKEPLLDGQLILSIHADTDADPDRIHAVAERARTVRLDDHLFTVSIEPELFRTTALGHETVFFKPPREGKASRVAHSTSLDEGIDRLLVTVSNEE